MIECLLILSKIGVLRIIKIYTEENQDKQINKQQLIKNVLSAIYNSKGTQIIYDFDYYENMKRKIAFRTFQGIIIAMIADEAENELAILDYINVMMKVFDEAFNGITEAFIINNPEKIYLIIDEMISGGFVIETNKEEIINNYMDKIKDDENYKYFSK